VWVILSLSSAFLESAKDFTAKLSTKKVDGSSPIFSTMTGGIVGVITTYIVAWLRKRAVPLRSFNSLPLYVWLVGLFYVLANLTSSFALEFAGAPYVFSMKRSSILISSLLGMLMLREKVGKWKFVGVITLTLGIVVLSFSV
jgi:uncharacterized membrane protein